MPTQSIQKQIVDLWKQMFLDLVQVLPPEEREEGYMVETCFDIAKGSNIFEPGEFIWVSVFPMRGKSDIHDQCQFTFHSNDIAHVTLGETHDGYDNYNKTITKLKRGKMTWKQAYETLKQLIAAWQLDVQVFPPVVEEESKSS